MVTPTTGEVVLDGEVVNDKPTSYRVERGVTMVPENRRLFKRLTVKENLELGAYLRNDDGVESDLERIYEMFPRVKERLNQKSGTLSGGEQQMVAMGRALMANPVLLMDEPSMGLAPALVQTNFELIQQIHEEGVAIFMVEQNANMALSIADRAGFCRPGVSFWTTRPRPCSRTRNFAPVTWAKATASRRRDQVRSRAWSIDSHGVNISAGIWRCRSAPVGDAIARTKAGPKASVSRTASACMP